MEWYKYVNEDVLVMVMTESKQLRDVIHTLRMFADKLESTAEMAEGDIG